MGTVVSINGLKIKVNAKDHNPPHCHVEGRGGNGRYDIYKMEWMEVNGFSKSDQAKIESVILTFLDEIRNLWSEYHE